ETFESVELDDVGEETSFDVGPGATQRFGNLELDAGLAIFEQPVGRAHQGMPRGRQPKHLAAQLRSLPALVALVKTGVVEQLTESIDPPLRKIGLFGKNVAHRPVQVATGFAGPLAIDG